VIPSAIHEHSPTDAGNRAVYLYEMMEKLGLEPSSGVIPQYSLRYATALHLCKACRRKKICRDWLDQAPPIVKLAPHFCPDADILFELQYDQLRTHS
jgi:Family of unknown function (DUF6455)